jgi:hypothetical protein
VARSRNDRYRALNLGSLIGVAGLGWFDSKTAPTSETFAILGSGAKRAEIPDAAGMSHLFKKSSRRLQTRLRRHPTFIAGLTELL